MGKVVYTFTNYDTNPDLVFSGSSNSDAPPFAATSSLFWERGNPLNVTIFNEQNQTLSEETYEYTFDHPNKKLISGRKSLSLSSSCGSSGSVSSTYQITSRPFTVKKKTSTIFDQITPTKKIANINEFTYDPTTYQLTSLTNYNSAFTGERYTTKFKYVTHSDYNFNRATYCQNALFQCQSGCGSNTYCLEDCDYEYEDCMDYGDPREKAISLDAQSPHEQRTCGRTKLVPEELSQ